MPLAPVVSQREVLRVDIAAKCRLRLVDRSGAAQRVQDVAECFLFRQATVFLRQPAAGGLTSWESITR